MSAETSAGVDRSLFDPDCPTCQSYKRTHTPCNHMFHAEEMGTGTVVLDWRYRVYLGPNDAVAPKEGGYWITDAEDLVARVWHDDFDDVWCWDVTEAEEVEYGGTPCGRDTTKSRNDAQAAAEACLSGCLDRLV